MTAMQLPEPRTGYETYALIKLTAPSQLDNIAGPLSVISIVTCDVDVSSLKVMTEYLQDSLYSSPCSVWTSFWSANYLCPQQLGSNLRLKIKTIKYQLLLHNIQWFTFCLQAEHVGNVDVKSKLDSNYDTSQINSLLKTVQ